MNRIALLIPHYNNPRGLADSLASVGADECVDAIVVDDGSTRAPLDEALALAAWQAQGEVKFLCLPHNRGIEHALNVGLAVIVESGYDYVARLDCGDLNLPDRCARQAAFLDAHPDVALVGSAVVFFDASGDRFTLNQPQSHAEIVRQMHDDNAFTHPAVMFRISAVKEIGFYPTDCKAAEDFAYFWQFVARYKTANLSEVLVRTEYAAEGISLSKRKLQQRTRLKILWRHFDWTLRSALLLLKPLAWQIIPFSLAQRVKRLLGVKSWS